MRSLYKKGFSKSRNTVQMLGGLLMVAGAVSYILFFCQEVAAWCYLVGAVVYTVVQALQTEDDGGIVLHRLHQLQRLSGLLLVLSGLLMVDDVYLWLLPLFSNYFTFVTYLFNKWVLLMLIGALLQLYTTLRIASLKNKGQSKKEWQ